MEYECVMGMQKPKGKSTFLVAFMDSSFWNRGRV